MVWTGFIWLRIETDGGLLWTRQWTFEFHKLFGSSWVAAELKKGSDTWRQYLGVASLEHFWVLLDHYTSACEDYVCFNCRPYGSESGSVMLVCTKAENSFAAADSYLLGYEFLGSAVPVQPRCAFRYAHALPPIFAPNPRVSSSNGIQPGVRDNILHHSKRKTGTAWTFNQLWSSHSRRLNLTFFCIAQQTHWATR
jgi:hypothetical protein